MRHDWKRENIRVVESDAPVDTSKMYPQVAWKTPCGVSHTSHNLCSFFFSLSKKPLKILSPLFKFKWKKQAFKLLHFSTLNPYKFVHF
jgi:hypothetical protein